MNTEAKNYLESRVGVEFDSELEKYKNYCQHLAGLYLNQKLLINIDLSRKDVGYYENFINEYFEILNHKDLLL